MHSYLSLLSGGHFTSIIMQWRHQVLLFSTKVKPKHGTKTTAIFPRCPHSPASKERSKTFFYGNEIRRSKVTACGNEVDFPAWYIQCSWSLRGNNLITGYTSRCHLMHFIISGQIFH